MKSFPQIVLICTLMVATIILGIVGFVYLLGLISMIFGPVGIITTVIGSLILFISALVYWDQ